MPEEVNIDLSELQIVSHLIEGKAPIDILIEEGGETGEEMAERAKEYTGKMDQPLDHEEALRLGRKVKNREFYIDEKGKFKFKGE